MQATDVADDPGLRIEPQRPARLLTRHQAGLQPLDIDAVVQCLDSLDRPLRQATAHVVTHRIGNAEQAQTLLNKLANRRRPPRW